MRVLLATCGLLAAVACTSSTKDDTPCAERAPEACGGCQELTARALVPADTGECFDTGATEVVGCLDTGVGCTAVISFAAPSEDGDCRWFSSGCTPEGWVSCEIETCH